MRLSAVCAGVLVFIGISVAASADGSSQLVPDSQLRYQPVFTDSGQTAVLADIDSVTSPRISPDGSRVAFSGSVGDESLGRHAIFVVDKDGTNVQQVTAGAYGEYDPTWSPDGRFITFSQNQTGSLSVTSCCRLARVDLQTGTIIGLTSATGAIRPSFSPAGTLLSYDNPAGVWTVPTGGGNSVLRIAAGYDSTFSPDGGSLAYVSNVGGLRHLRTKNIGSGSVRTVFSTSGSIESPVWRGGRIYFLHHTGLGYDGRSSVQVRSVTTSGSGLRTESVFSERRIGFDIFDNDELQFYRSSDGQFRYYDIGTDTSLGAPIQSGTYSLGWDAIRAVDLDGDGNDEVLFYRSSDGVFKYYETKPSGALSALVLEGTYSSGWDSITAVDLNGVGSDEILFYRSSDGVFKYYETRSTGALGPLLQSGTYSLGWSSLSNLDVDGDGSDELMFYRSSDGVFKYYETKPTGALEALMQSGTYSLGWDSLTAVDLTGEGRDEQLFYRSSDGVFKYYETKLNGALGPLLQTGAYSPGWSTIAAVNLDTPGK
jgi:hypothetical protein